MVSGKDERVYMDVPKCPWCGKKPDYWLISFDGDRWGWLFSEEGLSRYSMFKKVSLNQCEPADFKNVSKVKCAHQVGQTFRHTFREDDYEHADVFQAVVERAKYYIDTGRVGRV